MIAPMGMKFVDLEEITIFYTPPGTVGQERGRQFYRVNRVPIATLKDALVRVVTAYQWSEDEYRGHGFGKRYGWIMARDYYPRYVNSYVVCVHKVDLIEPDLSLTYNRNGRLWNLPEAEGVPLRGAVMHVGLLLMREVSKRNVVVIIDRSAQRVVKPLEAYLAKLSQPRRVQDESPRD